MEVGVPLVLVGAFISASMGFCLGRYVCRKRCQESVRKYKWIKAVDMAISEDGLILNLMLRMCFIIPFAALNFVCGVTDM